ncbi:hypothetical protein GY21_09660 [Cryobacterium roopkundense]|uniref:Transcriptional regulatory protein n=1 Tax=Cryobacterium roopkundense TaxID=1001240 RepID=A0A099JBD5_9MICO|nr:response regulator [Cryobacterium roopkundense]KGJ75699.1 hypothetical protein GY21_09660 [Cryobacterium roopkundense]MBB5641153.1 two-component system CitB family response regulator [Cryobacterium roopkundense]
MKLLRTVIIDDDRHIAGIHTGFLLAHGGFDVVGVATTGTEGLELISTKRPDLVLLDIHLPDISGIDVLRAARLLPGDPVDIIAITAARELETVRAAMAGGVMHYLVKPFASAVLLDRLDQYVQHRLTLRERHNGHARPLDQAGIDEMLRPRPKPDVPRGSAELSKGLSPTTLDAVTAALRAATSGSSAAAVAGELGLARVSARRYLEFLVTQDQATITQKYGQAGRPEKLYEWSCP